MNSGSHDREGGGETEVSAADTQHHQFCEEVADGLHALAQPLSVLVSAVELLAVAETAGLNRQRYIDLSVENVRRTCDLFGNLQSLLAIELQPPSMAELDFSEILTAVIEERGRCLHEAGIEIAVLNSSGPSSVFCDPDRTEKAVSGMFDMVSATGSRGDIVEITLSRADGYVECTILNGRAHEKTLNAKERLSLALSRANIVSQGGTCRYAEDPFCVVFALPVSVEGRQNCAA